MGLGWAIGVRPGPQPGPRNGCGEADLVRPLGPLATRATWATRATHEGHMGPKAGPGSSPLGPEAAGRRAKPEQGRLRRRFGHAALREANKCIP